MNLSPICIDQAFATVLASGSLTLFLTIFATPNVIMTLNLKLTKSLPYRHPVVDFLQTTEFAGKVGLL